MRRPARLPALALLLAGCGARSSLPGASSSPGEPASPSSVILFGGIGTSADGGFPDLGDTWTWTSAGGWTELHPQASPSPRFGAAAATLGSETVLFGGDGPVAETWVWDGTSWAQRDAAGSPPPMTSSVLVPLGQGLTLFSGWNSGVLYHDVWTWDGTGWAHPFPSVVPPPRDAPAGAVLNGQLVVFGGEDVNFEPLGDTWVYDGTSWTQITPAHSPSARRGAVAAAIDGKIVMFGGDTIPNGGWASSDETWVWDGTDWTQQHPAESPAARSFAGMATAGSEVVLFGGTVFGAPAGDLSGTWTWDGAAWTLHTGPAPAPRNEPTMASR